MTRQAHKSAEARTKGIAPVLLFALFMIILLTTLICGLSAYAAEVNRSDASKESRIAAGALTNMVRGADSEGCISSADGPEGKALVLLDRTSSDVFETRIYLYDGNLVQEQVIEGAKYDPEGAVPMFETDTFSFQLTGNLLTLTTDSGSVDVDLRSVHPDIREVSA
ncbi:MAG: DUF4860 domain-containing protein [Eggerthellaceae bacterium]|nr:DUF4860 domain-containing protein [Eggerthellaceae bacterium]